MKVDEKFLIQGLRKQDKAVFDLIFTYYYSGLCAYVNQFVENHDTSEDLVQEFFVRLWLNATELHITTSLKSYFFASVKNRAFDFLKHEKIKTSYANKAKKNTETGRLIENWEFTEAELRELIEKGIEKLPPRTREIFTMSRFRGISNDDISEQLDISKRTVEVQISSALKIMRKELRDYLPAALIWLAANGSGL
jgi:RNA polymerase sigma-70 factor, ECF subfamily